MPKKEVQPRMLWSYQETEDLIEIIQSKFLHKILSNKNGRKFPLFNDIKEELDKYGHDKTAQQIIFKWKNLCSMYRACNNRYGGSPPKRDKQFEFYQKMRELFDDVQNSSEIDYKFIKCEALGESSIQTNDDSQQGEIITSISTVEVMPSDGEIEEEIEYETDNLVSFQQHSNILKNKQNNKELTSNKINLKRKYSTEFDDEDPLNDDWEPLSSSSSKIHTKKTNTTSNLTNSFKDKISNNSRNINSNKEAVHSMLKDENSLKYTKCIDYLVGAFKKAQTDLQHVFYSQQLKLQQQQQEWEERILDEEREFFSKILKAVKSPETTQNENEY